MITVGGHNDYCNSSDYVNYNLFKLPFKGRLHDDTQ